MSSTMCKNKHFPNFLVCDCERGFPLRPATRCHRNHPGEHEHHEHRDAPERHHHAGGGAPGLLHLRGPGAARAGGGEGGAAAVRHLA
jgi:hypothetical protein